MPRLAAIVLSLSSIAGCGGTDPQSDFERLVSAGETALEARDIGFFRDVISERYVDSRGRDRERLLNEIRGYFLINPRIEAILRLEDVLSGGRDVADLTVAGAVVGRRGESVFDGIDADLHRVTLEVIREDGEWQIIGVRWSRDEDRDR